MQQTLRQYLEKTGQKVNDLSRILPYMNLEKRRILMSRFFTSQLNNFPLAWMFHSRAMNDKKPLKQKMYSHSVQ